MDEPPDTGLSELIARAFEPQEPRPLLRRGALDAVQGVNAHLLDLLCDWASVGGTAFPLADPLRSRLSRLSAAQRQQVAQSGILLADPGFSYPERWRSTPLAADCDPVTLVPSAWLPLEAAISLAHSTLLVAWYVLHASRAMAGVLLGMPKESVEAFVKLDVKELAYIARRHPDWIRLRSEREPKFWANLVAAGETPARSGFTTLRCLQLSGGQSKWLSPHLSARA
ncbi:MAG: hypothetical protein JWO52_5278 [Gammaproteobacteria bacterium]|jgi:hypothetical protein|nr:hypothetical protein [Gammaproteobacteria bacterium]